MKILPKHLFKPWVEHLIAGWQVVAPREVHGQHVFDAIATPDELALDYRASVLPAKKYLLPPREELFAFDARTLELEPRIAAIPPTVLLALHTCDLHAIALLDRIQDTGYPDQHYQARRRQMTLVSVECLEPCTAHAFCRSLGTLSVPERFDLHLTDLGDRYAAAVGSAAGERLIADTALFWEAGADDRTLLNRVLAAKWPRFDYRLDCDVTELPALLAASQHSPYWDEIGARCLACGQCTKVCPTCYCFDVLDDIDLKLEHGTRFRVWDSCQVEKFAVVAGGHNFRDSRAHRLRHRFMRKGKYQYEAYGALGCVGCGRCAHSCPAHITPIDTLNALHERHAPSSGEARSAP